MTIFEAREYIIGRQQWDNRMFMTAAWLSASLSRAKRIPALKSILPKQSKRNLSQDILKGMKAANESALARSKTLAK